MFSNVQSMADIGYYEHALKNGEAILGKDGQLCVLTGEHTGRAANDKYIVDDGLKDVAFGKAGKPMTKDKFRVLVERMEYYMRSRSNKSYVVEFIASGQKIRVITELAWHAFFVTRLFDSEPFKGEPDLVIVDMPGCHADPAGDYLESKTFIACDFARGLILIGGTKYAGEIKKSVFSYLSYILPEKSILPMHSSVVQTNDTSNVFFGLSGTGKTTLSSHEDYFLLGDDEHGWSHDGLYNFEAGCYAKAINLSKENERSIYKAATSPFTVMENVPVNQDDRSLDFNSSRYSENTRIAYKLDKIDNSLKRGTVLPHPENIIMLTCDATGVLPGVSKLDNKAAVYHFVSGYTAKVAGTEKGVKEPSVTFSACFGAPFMSKNVNVYANLFMERLEVYKPNVWLVNTGWIGGAPNQRAAKGMSARSNLRATRQIIDQIVSGALATRPFSLNSHFNLQVPADSYNNDPSSSWCSISEYDISATSLVRKFHENIKQFNLSDEIVSAGMPV